MACSVGSGSGSGGGGLPSINGVTEGVVAVGDTQAIAHAANPARNNLIIQNIGADLVQVYVTSALGFGGGGTQLAPKVGTSPGGVWSAQQDAGVHRGVVYAICGSGDSTTISVTEET